ncbi:transmembrane protein 171 isoform X2 [Meriones unguiculatus]|uniref:transmembrane protein 171 isoform X2 n=2 Tax=Meriones unguiculatus TaxID=10047 RepID=UPI000B4F39EA|nr:transmembrane protein 171 isoform X2 [Meriones unguiculatus]
MLCASASIHRGFVKTRNCWREGDAFPLQARNNQKACSLPVMSSVGTAEPDGDQRDRHVSKLIFFLFVLGAVLLCVGVLLSIFGYQACQHKPLSHCSMVLKIAGPSCAVMGLGAVILARSRARLRLREGQRRGQQDPDQSFFCGESRQFAQCLIFGFLFLTSGMLISILGIWVPGCGSDWAPEPLNETDTGETEPQICGFLSLQIMGPLIVLVGLCFFVVAHVKKKNNLSSSRESSEMEGGHTLSTEPVHITVGDSVIIFPPPPPPYFPEPSAGTPSPGAHGSHQVENPPSYSSLFNHSRIPAPEGQGTASERERELIFTISGSGSSSESSRTGHLPLDLPPRYEEKETAPATPLAEPSEPS